MSLPSMALLDQVISRFHCCTDVVDSHSGELAQFRRHIFTAQYDHDQTGFAATKILREAVGA